MEDRTAPPRAQAALFVGDGFIIDEAHGRDLAAIIGRFQPRRRRRRATGLSQAFIKRVLKADGRLELRPDGAVLITAADQTTNTTSEVNRFDIEAEKLRRQQRGDA